VTRRINDIGTLDGRRESIEIDKYPDFCPICNQHQTPNYITAFKQTYDRFQIIFGCPNHDCLSYFIAYYLKGFSSSTYELRNLRPRNFEELEFENEVFNLSATFCEIYEQAFFAEKRGYQQVAGCGYRKALEFLVKDYCISKNESDADAIKKLMLKPVIERYIADDTIKACAEKATWLGNDETHYVRKWEDMDMKDLKELIELTKYWIVQKIKTENYLKKMDKPKPA